MPPEPLLLPGDALPIGPGFPANDTVPCRLDLVLAAARPRRFSIDGVERLQFGEPQANPVLGMA